MTRLKPIGLSQEDREEPYEIIIPDRVQKLIDLYKKNHVEYPWTTEDKKNEQIFEYRIYILWLLSKRMDPEKLLPKVNLP
jgi:hypothetical protein